MQLAQETVTATALLDHMNEVIDIEDKQQTGGWRVLAHTYGSSNKGSIQFVTLYIATIANNSHATTKPF